MGFEAQRDAGRTRLATSLAFGEFKGAAYGGAPVLDNVTTHAARPEIELFADGPLLRNVDVNAEVIDGERTIALPSRTPFKDTYERLGFVTPHFYTAGRYDTAANPFPTRGVVFYAGALVTGHARLEFEERLNTLHGASQFGGEVHRRFPLAARILRMPAFASAARGIQEAYTLEYVTGGVAQPQRVNAVRGPRDEDGGPSASSQSTPEFPAAVVRRAQPARPRRPKRLRSRLPLPETARARRVSNERIALRAFPPPVASRLYAATCFLSLNSSSYGGPSRRLLICTSSTCDFSSSCSCSSCRPCASSSCATYRPLSRSWPGC